MPCLYRLLIFIRRHSRRLSPRLGRRTMSHVAMVTVTVAVENTTQSTLSLRNVSVAESGKRRKEKDAGVSADGDVPERDGHEHAAMPLQCTGVQGRQLSGSQHSSRCSSTAFCMGSCTFILSLSVLPRYQSQSPTFTQIVPSHHREQWGSANSMDFNEGCPAKPLLRRFSQVVSLPRPRQLEPGDGLNVHVDLDINVDGDADMGIAYPLSLLHRRHPSPVRVRHHRDRQISNVKSQKLLLQSSLPWNPIYSIEPVIRIKSRDTLTFHCLDASNGQASEHATVSAHRRGQETQFP
jgi:hypothetical protein